MITLNSIVLNQILLGKEVFVDFRKAFDSVNRDVATMARNEILWFEGGFLRFDQGNV